MTETDLLSDVPAAFLELSAREHIMYSPSLAGVIDTGPLETLEARTAIAALVVLVNGAYRAQKASDLALSWRNYPVGASTYMCNFETGFMGLLDGYNVKPESGQSLLNLHAEQIATAKGRLNGLNKVVGIAIYADPHDENANPDNRTTLRPCGRCINMLEAAPEVDERTLVLGANPDFTQCELYAFGALVVASAQGNNAKLETLTEQPFSLTNGEDFDYYDRCIQPQLIGRIYQLYGVN